MSEYFYTDPLKAAWMMDKFGVRILIPPPPHFRYAKERCYKLSTLYNHIYHKQPSPDRYYVHGEDYGVFEARDGDIGIGVDGYPCKFDSDAFRTEEGLSIGEARIIYRDGVHFMAPEKLV